LSGLKSRIKKIWCDGYVEKNSFIDYKNEIASIDEIIYEFTLSNLAIYLGYSVDSLKQSPKVLLRTR
jgi:hypothetical protein